MRALSVILLALVGAGLLARGHVEPSAVTFVAGTLLLAVALGPLALGLGRGRWPEGLLATGLASSLLLVALLAGEAVVRALPTPASEAPAPPQFGFARAKGDPEAFAAWWRRYLVEWLGTQRELVRRDPAGLVPGLFVPGASARFFDAEIRINQQGFRGPEISADKEGRYRIVFLGTSTTLGATMADGDEPWPRKVERRIRDELVCAAPVEVVNGGRIAFRLHHNLARLDADVFPLEPDLIVSVHNHAGFRVVNSLQVLPESEPAVVVRERGSQLLARFEATLGRALARRRAGARRAEQAAARVDEAALEAALLETRLADDYRALVGRARDRGIAVVLSNHPMAVDGDSPAEVVRFYEAGFPDVRTAIVLNRLHTRLVSELGRAEGVPVIDLLPGLDGAYDEAYIDLVHFTELGRERMAERIFEGLSPLLAADPRLRCERRA